MLAEIVQRSASERKGALKAVGTDEFAGRAIGMEDDRAVVRVESGRIIFANTETLAAGEGAGRGGPVNVFGGIARLPRTDATWFPWGISRGSARKDGGIVERTMGEEFPWSDRARPSVMNCPSPTGA